MERNLIELLVAEKSKVVTTAMSNKNPQWFEDLGVQMIEGDITNVAACKASVPESTDAVFHVERKNLIQRGQLLDQLFPDKASC